MQRNHRLSFGFQFGASLTFACFSHFPKKIGGQVARRATDVSRPSPRVLFGRSVSRIQKRSPSIWSRDVHVRRIKSIKTKTVQIAKQATSALHDTPRKRSISVAEKSKMSKCLSRLAPCVAALLLHVNMLIAVYAGAGLVTAARLHWDPSTYVAAREALPRLPLAKGALLAAAAALLLLPAAAALALRARRATRRALLFIYAVLMATMVVGEAAAAQWAARRLGAQLERGRARLHALVASTRQVLNVVATYHDFLETFQPILEEVEKDVPMNIDILKKAAIGLVVLQISGVVLALATAAGLRAPRALKLSTTI